MNAFPWLMRRELWENRSLYIVPLVFLGLLVAIYISIIFFGHPIFEINGHGVSLRQVIGDEANLRKAQLVAGALPFIFPAVILNITMFFLWFFYLTDSLYAERKDRSVLFWKSLPVDDTTTVLSKLATAMGVIPALTFVGIMIGAIGMTLANTLFAWTVGESAWQLVWSQLPFVSGPVTLLYALAVQSLWYAPVFGWLLLASAWARRAPALWALLPPAGIALLEVTILRSSNFLHLLGERLTPIVPTAYHDGDISVLEKMNSSDENIEWFDAFGSLIDPQSFLAEPGMWAGLLVAAVFVVGAIWLRRYRAEL